MDIMLPCLKMVLPEQQNLTTGDHLEKREMLQPDHAHFTKENALKLNLQNGGKKSTQVIKVAQSRMNPLSI